MKKTKPLAKWETVYRYLRRFTVKTDEKANQQNKG